MLRLKHVEHLLAGGVESYFEAEINLSIMDIVERLKAFIESEGKSCSYDPELITPMYVYRMWGGRVEGLALMEVVKNYCVG